MDGVRQMPVQLLTKCAWGNQTLANDQRFTIGGTPCFTLHTPLIPLQLPLFLLTPHSPSLSLPHPPSLLTNVSPLHGPQTHTAVSGGCHDQSLVLCEINGHNTVEVCTPCHQERGRGSDWLGLCHTHTVVIDGPQLQEEQVRNAGTTSTYIPGPTTSLSSSLHLVLMKCIEFNHIQMHLLKP